MSRPKSQKSLPLGDMLRRPGFRLIVGYGSRRHVSTRFISGKFLCKQSVTNLSVPVYLQQGKISQPINGLGKLLFVIPLKPFIRGVLRENMFDRSTVSLKVDICSRCIRFQPAQNITGQMPCLTGCRKLKVFKILPELFIIHVSFAQNAEYSSGIGRDTIDHRFS